MVTVYSRHGCHLCEDAVKTLESMREELEFEIEIIYIDGNLNLKSYMEMKSRLFISMENTTTFTGLIQNALELPLKNIVGINNSI